MVTIDALLTDDTARITSRARQWPPGAVLAAAVRAVLSVVAWLLVGAGRLAYVVLAGLWLAVTWCVAAVRVGWDDARQAAAREAG